MYNKKRDCKRNLHQNENNCDKQVHKKQQRSLQSLRPIFSSNNLFYKNEIFFRR
jgi:hypothetical protein